MSAAYERGDLSVVYPISRGVGPALAAVGGYFVLHERLTAMGVAGIGLILLAVVVISAGSSRDESAKAASPVAGALFAVLVGVMIAIYGVSDKVGVGIVHPFIFLMFGIGVPYDPPPRNWLGRWRPAWRQGGAVALYMGCAALDAELPLYLFALRLANTASPVRSVSVILRHRRSHAAKSPRGRPCPGGRRGCRRRPADDHNGLAARRSPADDADCLARQERRHNEHAFPFVG